MVCSYPHLSPSGGSLLGRTALSPPISLNLSRQDRPLLVEIPESLRDERLTLARVSASGKQLNEVQPVDLLLARWRLPSCAGAEPGDAGLMDQQASASPDHRN